MAKMCRPERFSGSRLGSSICAAARLCRGKGISMARWWKTALTIGACAAALSGCKRSESCEKGRMSLDRMWDGVQAQATKLKLASTEGSGPTASIWTGIQSDIDLLQSSFATEQITWESAKKKLGQLQQSIQ